MNTLFSRSLCFCKRKSLILMQSKNTEIAFSVFLLYITDCVCGSRNLSRLSIIGEVAWCKPQAPGSNTVTLNEIGSLHTRRCSRPDSLDRRSSKDSFQLIWRNFIYCPSLHIGHRSTNSNWSSVKWAASILRRSLGYAQIRRRSKAFAKGKYVIMFISPGF